MKFKGEIINTIQSGDNIKLSGKLEKLQVYKQKKFLHGKKKTFFFFSYSAKSL
jgi:hypothetical protein